MRHDLFNNIAGEDFLAIDDAWNFDDFSGLSVKFSLERSTLGAAWKVAENWFVYWGGWARDVVHHVTLVSKPPFQHHAV